jgi:hypothetical protein
VRRTNKRFPVKITRLKRGASAPAEDVQDDGRLFVELGFAVEVASARKITPVKVAYLPHQFQPVDARHTLLRRGPFQTILITND